MPGVISLAESGCIAAAFLLQSVILQQKLVMKFVFFFLLFFPVIGSAQQYSYEDSLRSFIKKYVDEHEVVKGADKNKMQFYNIDKHWRVQAVFKKNDNASWFAMSTSGKIKMQYRIYGVLTFTINDTVVKLNLYQSKDLVASPEYANYLFIPFTDKTSGIDTYGGGRYIDLVINDIKDNSCMIDFNKAYNPYCAYTAGYNCPIPPKENDVPVAVKAGEKNYTGH
jgi:uncharacterized protein